MEDKFYRNPEQIEELIKTFGKAILPKKDKNKPFLSPYRVFRYSNEQKSDIFPYHAQNPHEFIDEFSSYFENTINWDSPGVLYNIHPNINIYSQVASFFASFANPNFAQDISSGKLMLIEKELISYFARLADWDESNAGGIFTFGGKATNLYGLKIALDKAFPDIRTTGLRQNQKLKILSNDLGHPCHVEICNWMGVGTDNCVRIATTNSTLSVDAFITSAEKIIENGEKLPLIILNGMSTLNHAIDDIKKIAEARDDLVKKYALDYTPHIHVDSVIGWVYLLLARYDFELNPLNIDRVTLAIMRRKYELISSIKYADSFGADFHKTGFCGYASSLFMVKEKAALHKIEDAYQEDETLEFSKYSPYNYSIELSRSHHGPVSAFASLKTLGVEGFVRLLANMTEAFSYMKDAFSEQENTVVLNANEDSNILFFTFKPDNNIQLTENMDPRVVEEIKAFNTGFYQFLIHKLEKDEASIFFSCSRSHKYLGQTFGSIKLYCYNSNFDVAKAKEVVNQINDLFAEYKESTTLEKDYNIFDFLDIKGKA